MSVTLIVGDVHLGKSTSIGRPGIGNALNSRIQDQIKLLYWCLDQAQKHNAGAIILTGDICEDPKPEYFLIEVFIDWLKACEISNIEVHIIAGNHDITRTGNYYRSFLDVITSAELPLVHVYKHINTIQRPDVGFTLVPFRDRNSLESKTEAEALCKISTTLSYELESIPSNHDKVLIGHLALKGSMFVGDEFDNLANELMCPVNLFKGYDYVWMGHVHKPQVRRKKNPYAAHIGSLDISDFGETDHQKIVVIYDTSYPDKFIDIPVPSRPLRRIRLDVPKNFDPTEYVTDQIKASNLNESFQGALVKIELKLLDPESEGVDRKKVFNTLYDLGAFYVCNLSESKNITVVEDQEQYDIDSKMDKKAAVKIWAESEQSNLDEDEVSEFIDCAIDIINTFQVN